MLSSKLVFAFLLCSAGWAAAKPLVESSEESVVSICEQNDRDSDEMIQACSLALAEPGLTTALRLELHVNLAKALYYVDRNTEAEAAFHEILELDPNHAPALHGLAWVWADEDEDSKAAELFQKSVDLAPSASALVGLGSSSYWADLKPLDEALLLIDAGLALSPNYVWALREKGWLLREEDRWQESLEPFRAALKIREGDANAHFGLARSLYELNEYEQALEHINKAIQRQPNRSGHYLWRAHIMRMLSRHRQAINDATKALEMAPKNSSAHVALARAQFDAGKRTTALDTIRKARETLPDSQFVAYWLGKLLYYDDQTKLAWEAVLDLTQMDDADGYDFNFRATLALDRNDLEDARQSIDKALEISPWIVHSYFVNAEVMVREGRIEEALTQFKDAYRMDNDDYYLDDMVKALISKGRFVEAIALRFGLPEGE